MADPISNVIVRNNKFLVLYNEIFHYFWSFATTAQEIRLILVDCGFAVEHFVFVFISTQRWKVSHKVDLRLEATGVC